MIESAIIIIDVLNVIDTAHVVECSNIFASSSKNYARRNFMEHLSSFF
ncbi:hypothetical protein NTGBS_420002 [Candidatus Nitrotoga sp. BS]|nr:hypothetical protein NTGBS_420002 [Candidatus Nitrotoga sp. BS]